MYTPKNPKGKTKDYIIKEHDTGRIYKITEDYDPITNYEPTEKEKQDFLNRETARLKQQETEQQQTKGKSNAVPNRVNQVKRFDRLMRGEL